MRLFDNTTPLHSRSALLILEIMSLTVSTC